MNAEAVMYEVRLNERRHIKADIECQLDVMEERNLALEREWRAENERSGKL